LLSLTLRLRGFAFLLFCVVPLVQATATEIEERPGLARYFDDAGVSGTIAIHDIAAAKIVLYNPSRARIAYLPASTFKIPAALIALEAGVVEDAFENILPWDGVEWMVPACNADQTLATALQRSCMPFFARLGKRIGDARLNEDLAKFDYGNHDASGAYPYWIRGNLRISALQQIAFLDRLRRDDLPASPKHMQAVRDMLVIEEGDGYVLRAKTGWAMDITPNIGWIVGWVERDGKTYLFALNLDIESPDQAPARLNIAKSVLEELGALP
jgi:beta-lactamase class D